MRRLAATMIIAASTASAAMPPPPATPWQAPYADGDTKYFAFHKSGVALPEAMENLAECVGYITPTQAFGPPPDVALLGEQYDRKRAISVGLLGLGLAGTVIADIVDAGFQAKTSRGNLRRCMSYYGYQRYAITKEAWAWVHSGGGQIDHLAALAVGKTPSVARLAS